METVPPEQFTPKQLEKWLDDFLSSDLAPLVMPDTTGRFVPSPSSLEALSQIKQAIENGSPLVGVFGPSGCGKSEVGRYFASSREHFVANPNRFYRECQPGMDGPTLMKALAVELRISQVRDSNVMIGMVYDALRMNPVVGVLDEAQRLVGDALDLLRYFADNSGSTFVLITESQFEARVTAQQNVATRMYQKIYMSRMDIAELRGVKLMEGFRPEVVEAIHQYSGGTMREVVRLVRSVDNLCEINAAKGLMRSTFQPHHLDAAAARIGILKPAARRKGGKR